MDNLSININNMVIENVAIALLNSIKPNEIMMEGVLQRTNMDERMLRHLIANADTNHLLDIILEERPEDCIVFDAVASIRK